MFTTPFELADGDKVKPTVNLEAIASIPITTLFDQSDKQSKNDIDANKEVNYTSPLASVVPQ